MIGELGKNRAGASGRDVVVVVSSRVETRCPLAAFLEVGLTTRSLGARSALSCHAKNPGAAQTIPGAAVSEGEVTGTSISLPR